MLKKKGKHAQLHDNDDDRAFQMGRQVIILLDRFSVSLFANLAEYNAFGIAFVFFLFLRKGL